MCAKKIRPNFIVSTLSKHSRLNKQGGGIPYIICYKLITHRSVILDSYDYSHISFIRVNAKQSINCFELLCKIVRLTFGLSNKNTKIFL